MLLVGKSTTLIFSSAIYSKPDKPEAGKTLSQNKGYFNSPKFRGYLIFTQTKSTNICLCSQILMHKNLVCVSLYIYWLITILYQSQSLIHIVVLLPFYCFEWGWKTFFNFSFLKLTFFAWNPNFKRSHISSSHLKSTEILHVWKK